MNKSHALKLAPLALGALIAAAAIFAGLWGRQPASASPGSQVFTCRVPVTYIGDAPSLAFDGVNLLYANPGTASVYRMTATGSPCPEAPPAVPALTDMAALAFDGGRGTLWGTVASGGTSSVYTVDAGGAGATWRFDLGAGRFNGLAYDASDDTLWASADRGSKIYRYTTSGTLLDSCTVWFPISGLAVGGSVIYASAGFWARMYALDKASCRNDASPTLLTHWPTVDGAYDEDLECDPVTFAPTEVVWSKGGATNAVYAWEVAAGSCALGGGATPTPTSTSTPTDTPTATPTETSTPTPTDTPSPTPTDTATATPTPATCPPNPNFDGDFDQGGPGISNGTGMPEDDGTVPMSDAICDDEDPDDDNDGIPDASDPDPRGDNTYDDDRDGNPCPPMGTDADDDGPSWDANCNGIRDGVEGACTGSTADADGDGLPDAWEACKWGSNPYASDSDGDTLNDCQEAADINGDGTVDFVVDTYAHAQAALLPAASFGKDGNFDLNGDTLVDYVTDVVQEAKYALIPGLCR